MQTVPAMARSTMFLATALVTFTACAASPAADDPSGGGGGKADGDTTTITFAGDFTETADGPLLAGDSLHIAYDLDRLTDCKTSSGGSDKWGVSGYVQFDGGAAKPFAVSKLAGGKATAVTASIGVPASAQQAVFWFEINDTYGCHAVDSNMGDNYAFAVEHTGGGAAVLAFDGDWTESQSAAIHAGDAVVVHYDPARLAQCAGSQAGHAAWGITGYWQVDGGTVHSLMVTAPDGATLVSADPTLAVPHGTDLALWFEATSIWGCHAYDSDFGNNYHVTIE